MEVNWGDRTPTYPTLMCGSLSDVSKGKVGNLDFYSHLAVMIHCPDSPLRATSEKANYERLKYAPECHNTISNTCPDFSRNQNHTNNQKDLKLNEKIGTSTEMIEMLKLSDQDFKGAIKKVSVNNYKDT